jgi:hypothetical protein
MTVEADDGLPVLNDHIGATRASLHHVAAHVVAPVQFASIGKISLVVTDGGFGTRLFHRGDDPEMTRIRVQGANLVFEHAGEERSEPISTPAAAYAFAGIDGPSGLELPGGSPAPAAADEVLPLDPGAVRALAGWWALGDDVLDSVDVPAQATASAILLWPEHFDVAIALTLAGGAAINLGFSPGDDFSPTPYVYAGPFEARTGKFWNAPFGAYRTYDEIRAAGAGYEDQYSAALAFLHQAIGLL